MTATLEAPIEQQSPKDNALALAAMPTDGFKMVPRTFEECYRLAVIFARTNFCPDQYRGKPSDCLLAMMYGAELGLSPIQALQGVLVINGKPSVYGDTAMGLVRQNPKIKSIVESLEGEGDDMTATCAVTRDGDGAEEVITRSFSVADAKTAKLWGKKGKDGQDTPWVTYPKRMLQMRARGFALRDAAADTLRGLMLAEEAQDIQPTVTVTRDAPAMAELEQDDPRTQRLNELAKTLKWTPARIEVETKAVGNDPDALIARMEAELEHEDKRKTRMANKPEPKAEPASADTEEPVAEAAQEDLIAKPPAGDGPKMNETTRKALFAMLNELGKKEKPARLLWAAGYGVAVDSFTKLSQAQAEYLCEKAQVEGPPKEQAPIHELYANVKDEPCAACEAKPGDTHVPNCPEVYVAPVTPV